MTQLFELISVLEKTVSTDQNELLAAQHYFEQAAIRSLPDFLKALSDVLAEISNSAVARMAAGLQLKNHLTSKDSLVKQQYQQRWLQFPQEIREYIKHNILRSIGTENTRPSSAAQCVAYVAVVELPIGQWNDLITVLVNKVIVPSSTEMDREASLEAIGYICQDINSDVLESQSNSILTAIIHGMRKQEASNHVRLAATTALLNSLEFTRSNFDKESERNYIMEVVCEATQSTDTQICVAALQCLVRIMTLYYQYMQPYIGQALFPIALNAMKSEHDEIALQGIEFWSNVSDVEIDLSMEVREAEENGRVPTTVSQHYARGALPFIVEELLKKLTKQDECDDDDNWNPTKAASVCLMLLASCCENEIVPHVLPFIRKHINDPNWHYRDAAVMVFGSVLNGLDAETSKPLVEQAMPTLIELMYDQNVNVRDSTAWTFGRIGGLIPGAAMNETYLKPLLESMMHGLKSEPRVAANVCWAFTNLSEAAYEIASTDGNTPETYCLSPYFEYIVKELLATTDRGDATQHNLRGAAYEALMDMIKNSPNDCYLVVQQTTIEILRRLNQILQMDSSIVNPSDRTQINDMQSLLCATLQSVLRKVSESDAPMISDQVMTALLTMFNSNSGKSGGVQEDGLMAVSTLVDLLGENFLKYMNAFKPYLYMGLRNHQEYQVCSVAVGLAGDICRNLKEKILPYCDEMMQLLLETISNDSLHRTVKPQILSVFGDVAISIGGEFKKYLALVLQMLSLASQVQVDRNDYENVEYLNELRDSVLEAYTGIVQGLKGPDEKPNQDVQLIIQHVPFIIDFIAGLATDEDVSNTNLSASAGLIGDLCTAFGAQILPCLEKNDNISRLLEAGRGSKVARTKQLCNWAMKQIRLLREQNTTADTTTA